MRHKKIKLVASLLPAALAAALNGCSKSGSVLDHEADAASACPAQLPIGGGAACSGALTCNYDQMTCCGITSAAYTCQCQGSVLECVMFECNYICPDAGRPDAQAQPGTGGAGGGTGGAGGGTGGGPGTGGSRSDAGSDAAADAASGCPAQLPIGGGACSGALTCTYGQSACCGVSSSAYTCQCQGGSFSCLMTVECNFVCPDAGHPDAQAQPGTGGAGGGTGGAGGGTGGAGGGADGGACVTVADCPVNPGAACKTTCSDGSNACANACVNGQCVPRGCPGDDAGASPHTQGESCDDGLGCTAGLVCKAIGDPCGTYPNCKVCYLPCQADGGCPGNYSCAPPSGQGGDVCVL